VLRFVQIGLWAAVVAVGLGRIHTTHRAVVDGTRLARAMRTASPDVVRDLLEAASPAPLRHLAAAAGHRDPEDAEIALREGWLRAEREILRGVATLRILGVVSSAIGFVAVAHQIAWISMDHGVLDLDPARVGRMAAERAAVALALALASSGTAVGLAGVLRARARADLRDLSAVRNAIERALPRWTTGRAQ
jgi:hypothetical protein